MDENENPFAAPQTDEEPDTPFEKRLADESKGLTCGALGCAAVLIVLAFLLMVSSSAR